MPSMTLTCAVCGKPMQRHRTSAPQGVAKHRACAPQHGASGYRRGCRCATCKSGQSRRANAWMAEFKAAHGISYASWWRKRYRLEVGAWPYPGRGSDWISKRKRLALYERDGWACYICNAKLSADTPINTPLEPTLDHVLPRSRGGSDEPENLRTCCRSCNVRKSNTL